ncbi:MAG: hypothetical protein ABR501_06420 [Pyrinomonadaceae bacterium]
MAVETKRTESGRLISSCIAYPRASVIEVEVMRVGAKRDKESEFSEWIGGALTHYNGAERRGKPRIIAPFSAVVRGVNSNGEPFQIYTDLHNLSAAGVYFAMEENVTEGSRLFIVTRLARGDETKPAAQVAIRVVVLRVQRQREGLLEVAGKILQNRFLWQRDSS